MYLPNPITVPFLLIDPRTLGRMQLIGLWLLLLKEDKCCTEIIIERERLKKESKDTQKTNYRVETTKEISIKTAYPKMSFFFPSEDRPGRTELSRKCLITLFHNWDSQKALIQALTTSQLTG